MKQHYRQLRSIFLSDLNPHQLAMSVSIGMVCALFPVVGTTTILSLIFCLLFRLNLLVTQLLNWLLAPIHLLMIVPMFKLGENLFGGEQKPIGWDALKAAFSENIWRGFEVMLKVHQYAIYTWAVMSLPLALVVYFSSLYWLNRTARARAQDAFIAKC